MAAELALRHMLASPEAQRLARNAPLELLVQTLSAVLPLIERQALVAYLGEAPAWLAQVQALSVSDRATALQRGVHQADPTAVRLVMVLVELGRSHIQAALPEEGGPALRDGLALALHNAPAPLPQLAAHFSAPGAATNAAITAEDRSKIERGTIHLPPTGGPITATISAKNQSTVSNSNITVAHSPPSAVNPHQPQPPTHPTLIIAINAHQTGGYHAEAQVIRATSRTTVRQAAATTLDPIGLLALSLEPHVYGQRLTADLLADSALQSFVISALHLAQATAQPLQLQIRLAASATELHALRWELLCDPINGDYLATSQHVWLARKLDTSDWTPVTTRARDSVRGLAVLAAPTDLERYGLESFNVEPVRDLVRTALGEQTHILTGAMASLGSLEAELRQGYDILYFVGHGRTIANQTHLWLSAADGRSSVTRGAALVQRIRELQHRPVLAVLMACESAGSGDAQSFAALGPELVRAGIPAVIAAQGSLRLTTATRFTTALCAALYDHGQLARAVADARAAVRDEDDWWALTVLTSLDDGRLW